MDDVEPVEGGWLMWANENDRALPSGPGFTEPGHRRFAEAFGGPPVRVLVRECEDGPYWGWINAEPGPYIPSYPTMIYGHRGLFRMCFPYNPEPEVAAGKGRIVRLSIEPA